VLIGRITCLEVYFAMLDFVIVATALLLCDSIRPVIPNLITFLFRIPLEHAPGYPGYSTYYTGTKIVFFAIFASVFFASLTYFFIKNKTFSGVNILKTPMFIPLSVFSLSFLVAGMFSGNRMKEDLGFSLLQVFVFFVVYLILYYGLRKENSDELFDYFIYVGAMCAVVLVLEVLDVILRVDGAMVNGALNKSFIDFGWGISNTCGSALSVLSPLCVLGAMRSERRLVSVAYFAIGTITTVAIYFTLARTSVLVGTVGFIICIIISCFAGKQKQLCRISTVTVTVLTVAVIFIFRNYLADTFTYFSQKGLDDSGRKELWQASVEHFKGAPVFGNGFFSLPAGPKMSSFTPPLAHNTFLQLLSSMGVFGLIAYVVYRVRTVTYFFKSFNIYKFTLAVSCGILVFESLIDNFIFWFSPTFVYNLCIIIAIMHCEQTAARKAQDALSDDSVSSDESVTEGECVSPDESKTHSEGIVFDSPITDTVTHVTL
jgi:O-antigen ligase